MLNQAGGINAMDQLTGNQRTDILIGSEEIEFQKTKK